MSDLVPAKQTLWGLFAKLKERDDEADSFWDNFNPDEPEPLLNATEDKIDAYYFMEDSYNADADRLERIAKDYAEKAKVQRGRAERIRKRLITSMEFWKMERFPGKERIAIRSTRKASKPTFLKPYPDADDLLRFGNCVEVAYRWKAEPDYMVASQLDEMGLVERRYIWNEKEVKQRLKKERQESDPIDIVNEIARIDDIAVFKWDIKKKG